MVNPENLCFVAIMPLYHIVSIFISIPKQSKSESNNKAHVQQEKKNDNGGEGWKAKKARW